jgi:hypothetical protein
MINETVLIILSVYVMLSPVIMLYSYMKGYEAGADDIIKGVKNVIRNDARLSHLGVFQPDRGPAIQSGPSPSKGSDNGRK